MRLENVGSWDLLVGKEEENEYGMTVKSPTRFIKNEVPCRRYLHEVKIPYFSHFSDSSGHWIFLHHMSPEPFTVSRKNEIL